MGFDHAKWLQVGEFDTELDVWEWIGDVEPDTRVARALRSMARPQEVVWREKRKGKPGAMDAYLAYLRSRDSPYYMPNAVPRPPAQERPEPNNLVDPDRPNELAWHAADALRYWGKEDEYGRALEVKKVVAREMWEKQQARIKRREEQQLVNEEAERRRQLEAGMEGLGLGESRDGVQARPRAIEYGVPEAALGRSWEHRRQRLCAGKSAVRDMKPKPARAGRG